MNGDNDDCNRQRACVGGLSANDERLRHFVEFSADLLWEIDTAGRFTFVSPKSVEILGFTPAELIGRTPFDLMPPIEGSRFESLFRAASADRSPMTMIEHVTLHRDGRPVIFETSAVPLLEAGGRLAGYCGISRDVSGRKRMEEERRRLDSRIQQTQKLECLGALAGGVAHDFNNLLAGVLGNVDMALHDLPAGTPVREHLHDAEAAARRAVAICQQMLACSGRGRLAIEHICLNDIIRGMMPMLTTSLPRNVALNCQLAPNLPACEADAAQIRQIIMNLVANSIEAIGSQDGIITVCTDEIECSQLQFEDWTHEGATAGRHVVLTITDSGCGMTPDVQRRLFDPFFSTKFTGRGLGLAAVLGIVRGHRGAIKIDSSPGHGASVRILLPASSAKVTQHGVAAAGWQGSGTILLADDEPSVRVLGNRMLKRLGFQVILAEDGRDALDIFEPRRSEITGVILDLMMPRLDGAQACGELHRLAPALPIILSSGYSQQEVMQRIGSGGVQGFLQKPYTFEDLTRVVREAFQPAV